MDVSVSGGYGPVRWGFVFLACPLPLEEAQRLTLVRLAARAWFENATELDVVEDEFRATVRPTSDSMLLGSFFGQRFTAEVHLPERSGKVEFLVAEAALRQGGQTVGEA